MFKSHFYILLPRNWGNLKKKRFLLFILAFCLIFVWRCWFLTQEIQTRYLQVTVNAPVTETAQLYYDQGDGFNEYDSVVSLPIHNTSNVGSNIFYQFQLTPSVIYAMHFVLDGSGDGVQIQKMDVLDGLGLHLRTIDLASLQIVSSSTSRNSEAHDKGYTSENRGEKQQFRIFLDPPLPLGEKQALFKAAFVSRVLVEGVGVAFVLAMLFLLSNSLLRIKNISEKVNKIKKSLLIQSNQDLIVFISITALYFWGYRPFASHLFPLFFEKAFSVILILLVVRYFIYSDFQQVCNKILVRIMGCYLLLLIISASMHFIALSSIGIDNYLSITDVNFQGVLFDKNEYLSKIFDSSSDSDQTFFLYIFPFVFITAISVFQSSRNNWKKLLLILLITLPNLVVSTYCNSTVISSETLFGDSIVSLRILLFFLFPLCVLFFVLLKPWWQKIILILIALDILWLVKVTYGRATILGILIFLLLLPLIQSWVQKQRFLSSRNVITFLLVCLVGGLFVTGFALPKYHALLSKVMPYHTVSSAHALLTGKLDGNSPVSARSEMMCQAVRLVKDAPIAGWGPAAFQNNVDRIRFQNGDDSGISHVVTNLYLLFLGNFGVLGLVLFVLMQIFPLVMIICTHKKISSYEERWVVGIVFTVCVIMLLLFNTNPYISFLEINWIYLLFLGYLFSVGKKYEFSINIKRGQLLFPLIACSLVMIYIGGVYRVTFGESSYQNRNTVLLDEISQGYERGKKVELLHLPRKDGKLEVSNRLISTRATPFHSKYTTYIHKIDVESTKVPIESQNNYYCLNVSVAKNPRQDFYMELSVYINGRRKDTHDFQIDGNKKIVLLFSDENQMDEVEIKASAWWAIPYHEDFRNNIGGGQFFLEHKDFVDLGVKIDLVQYSKS